MNGHQAIIQMRIAGKRPAVVFLNDFPCQTDWAEHGDHATVEIAATDRPEALDLRYLIGTTVSICGTTVERTKSLVAASVDAGARVVLACSLSQVKGQHYSSEWETIWQKS